MTRQHKPEIILIAAMAANRVIGKDNTIPWHIPGELARFKETTMGHPMIMGRKTWQSLGRPLPGRRNIVLTRNRSFEAEGAEVVGTPEEGIELCADAEKLFIIGGAQVYSLFLPLADTLLLTVLDQPVEGDTCFPEFSQEDFQLVSQEIIDGSPPYRIQVFRKRKKKNYHFS